VAAQKASVSSAEADATAMESSLVAADESLLNTRPHRAHAGRPGAVQPQLPADGGVVQGQTGRQADLDTRRTDYDSKAAAVREAQAHYAQTKAQRTRRPRSWPPRNAMWRRPRHPGPLLGCIAEDYSTAPLDGMVTNLPVRVAKRLCRHTELGRLAHHDHRDMSLNHGRSEGG